MTTDLLVPIKAETRELFTTNGVDAVLKAVDEKIKEFNAVSPDTQKNRDKIRSFAAKVVKTKTFLEKTGKDFVAEKKAEIKIFDASRKRLRDSLSEKAAEVRQPLTDYEEAEKARVEAERQHELYLMDWDDAIAENDIFNREREIKQKEAEIARQEEERRQEEEAERLASRLKKEVEEKVRREADEKIAFEKAERERIEREAKEAEEQAERDKEAAIQRAKDEAAAEAKRKEQQRLDREAAEERKRQEEKRIAEKKAANKRHQAHINNKIVFTMANLGVSADIAKLIITAVAKGEIPYMKIEY